MAVVIEKITCKSLHQEVGGSPLTCLPLTTSTASFKSQMWILIRSGYSQAYLSFHPLN